MSTKRCANGHHYDPAKHSSCPLCSKVAFDSPKTQMAPVVTPVNRNVNQAAARLNSDQETVAVFKQKTGIDPVVGWLVCLKGPERGQDYRIHAEKNFIGRDASMDICIKGDPSISREKHATIGFNPKNSSFKVYPGESRGLVYLNGEEVDTPQEIKQSDSLEIGESQFILIPLCDKKFNWE